MTSDVNLKRPLLLEDRSKLQDIFQKIVTEEERLHLQASPPEYRGLRPRLNLVDVWRIDVFRGSNCLNKQLDPLGEKRGIDCWWTATKSAFLSR